MAADRLDDDDIEYDDDGAAWYAAAAAEQGADENEPDTTVQEDPYLDTGAANANADPYQDSGPGENWIDQQQSCPPATVEGDSGELSGEVAGPQAGEKRPIEPADQHQERPEKAQKVGETSLPKEEPIPSTAIQSESAPREEALPAQDAEPMQELQSKEQAAEEAQDAVESSQVKEPLVDDVEDLDAGPEWDEKVLVVRQGQVHIELQNQKPPMQDEGLLRFCDWLTEQMPIVVKNFPYVRNSGAYIDLSDNNIGPEGLDKLFRVLRDHRVPCVVMKAYRNCLDDSIIDTLIEYLYTQPESFPMHGIHISHNQITDKGAMRLARAAAQCGHYPRLTSRLPLWLRLEFNDIHAPHKLVADCLDEGFNVCLMGDGMCSRPDCNHYSGVHVQLPYFFNQHRGRKLPRAKFDCNADTVTDQDPEADDCQEELPEGDGQVLFPDWMRNSPRAVPQTTIASVPRPPRPLLRPTHSSWIPARPPPPVVDLTRRGGDGGNWSNGDHNSWQNDFRKGGQGWYGPDWGKGKGGWWGQEAPESNWKGAPRRGGKGGKVGKSKQMWHGLTLDQKVKNDVKLLDADPLSFTWCSIGEGKSPQVTSVEPDSTVSAAAEVGHQLLRVNGLDVSMFNEKQVTDMLKQRPLSLRFGNQ